ncbi:MULTISPECIES: hypothetical protein [Streptomyces]|uniref:Uncharacterized protein n=2 Tax=Streptomyces TaxID=1883 RepID=A0ABV9IY33_9ACTN
MIRGRFRRYGVPLLVHLLIGLPTLPALLCARWYAAHGHCDMDDYGRSGLRGCSYDQIEDSGFVLIGLFLFGGIVLLLLLLYDVLRVRYAGLALRPRLLTLPAVLVPYVAYVVAASWR